MSIRINRRYLETYSINFDRNLAQDHCSDVILSFGTENLHEIGYGTDPEEIHNQFKCDPRKGEIYLLCTLKSSLDAEKLVMDLNHGFGLNGKRMNYHRHNHTKNRLCYLFAFIRRGR